ALFQTRRRRLGTHARLSPRERCTRVVALAVYVLGLWSPWNLLAPPSEPNQSWSAQDPRLRLFRAVLSRLQHWQYPTEGELLARIGGVPITSADIADLEQNFGFRLLTPLESKLSRILSRGPTATPTRPEQRHFVRRLILDRC